MSEGQHPPSVLTVKTQILGVGHFQGRDVIMKICQSEKALYFIPDKLIRPAAGVWVEVHVNQLESYQIDFTHGLLYMTSVDGTSCDLATRLVKMVDTKDLMPSHTKLRGSAVRMWLAEDVDLARIVEALDRLGVTHEELGRDQQYLAKAMFPGIKATARQANTAPLANRSHSSNPMTRRHADLLLERLTTVYDNGTASDCNLISRDGQEFLAHRVILAAWSPVFANMFATNMTEKATGVCRLENYDGHVIDALLSFLYKGTLPDIDQSVENVLDFAEQYEIPDLRMACEAHLAANITSKNAPRYLYLADLRGLGSLKAEAAKFIGEHVSDF